MNELKNCLLPHARQKLKVPATYRRIKTLLIALVCVGTLGFALMAQPKNDASNGSAVFTFATPCNDDTESECLYFQWPTMYGGAARVAIPFFGRPVKPKQNQVSKRVEREGEQLSYLADQHTCIEFMGEFCR